MKLKANKYKIVTEYTVKYFKTIDDALDFVIAYRDLKGITLKIIELV